jgi:hypothetical protein
LHHIADAERRERNQPGEDRAEPGHAEALAEDVHRSAAHLPRGIRLAIMNGHDDFGKLRAHAEHARHP